LSLSRLLLESRPAAQPIALKSRDTVITWDAFIGGIEILYQEIASSSVDKWILACPDPIEFLAAIFAVWHAGKIPVIPSNYQKESISTARGISDGAIEKVDLSPSKRNPTKFKALDLHASKVILFTSGSSGKPKLVEKTLFQLDSEVLSLELQWGSRVKAFPVVATVPHYHIYGLLFRLLWPVLTGRVFVADELTMPDILFSRIRNIGPVVLISSPAHLTRIPSIIDLQDIRSYITCIFSSGAPLPEEMAALYAQKMGVPPIEVYGSTETGGIGWRQGGSLWTPLPSVHIRISEVGTLEARSPHTDNQDWVRTEDLSKIDDDGRFSLSGRADRIVKIEGKRVSLDEMTARLNNHPWVDGSGIVFLERARNTLGAAVVLSKEGIDQHNRQDKPQIVGRLKEHLSQWFEPVVIPRLWRFVSHLPTTDRGKTATSGLISLFADDPGGPVVLSMNKTANVLDLSLFVPSTLPHFKGHFPEFPVLPGVLKIHWAAFYGMRELNIKGSFAGISRLKFHRVILPNTDLTLHIVAHNNKLDFSYNTDEGVHSSGRLEFK
jgi:acyl-coenzyme A synthetase/AMP-(fatty) acid ligase